MITILEVDINGDHNNNSVNPPAIQARQAIQQYPADSPDNYIYDDTGAATEDLFEKRPLNDLIVTWSSLTVRARVYRENDANPCQARLIIEDPAGGGPSFGDAETLSTTSQLISHTWAINPDTGLPWTRTQLNAFEIGIELTGNAATEARCTQLWAEAQFASACNLHAINSTHLDHIPIDEDLNLSLPAPILLYDPQITRTVEVKLPDGSTSTLNNTHLVDDTRFLASIPSGSFPTIGKYRVYAEQTDAAGTVVRGKPFPMWIHNEFE